MTKLLFTKSNTILSRAIRWLFNEPVSHFALCFDDKIVFHSNLLGAHLKWLSTFMKHSQIVYMIKLDLSLEEEEEIYQNMINTFDERPYDFKAFFYFAWRGLLLKLFNKPLPSVSFIENDKKYLCTEIAYALPCKYVPKINLCVVTPYMLYNMIKEEVENGNIS